MRYKNLDFEVPSDLTEAQVLMLLNRAAARTRETALYPPFSLADVVFMRKRKVGVQMTDKLAQRIFDAEVSAARMSGEIPFDED